MDMNAWHCLAMPDAVNGAVEAPSLDADGGIGLRDFLASNYERLHRRLQRHLGCPDLASDSLHDAWLRLGEMSVPATVRSPEAYVYRVACNVAMDRLRNSMPRQYTGDADSELEYLADPSPGPSLIAEARSELAAVDRALEQLPHRHQDILVCLRLEDLTREQVALRHGLSMRRVDTMLKQALNHCAEQSAQTARAGVRASRRVTLAWR